MGGIYVELEDEDVAYERDRQREVDAENEIKCGSWWEERLGGLSISKDVAQQMARCMVNIDAACNGCPISRDAILNALTQIKKQARLDALDYL